MDRPSDLSLARHGRALLDWYDVSARTLPWRLPPGAAAAAGSADPYRVWLSEVMLQQTTVAAVIPYVPASLSRWPAVVDLAAAPEAEVMKAWAGLGYYSRARNLKRCAETVATRCGGVFPRSAAELQALPGIGPYTAAAIAAIAFGEPVAVIDGNVERVAARLLALDAPVKSEHARVRGLLSAMMPIGRAGDFAQALMDLGATVCTPKRPACARCPLAAVCAATAAAASPEAYPVKAPRPDRPLRRGAAFVARRPDGAVLLRRRPPHGLLGGMTEVPTTEWRVDFDGAAALGAAPLPLDWRRLAAPATHGFTHFRLALDVFHGEADASTAPPPGAWWSPPEGIAGEALSTAMRKVIAAACPDLALGRRA
jgi:A/G-specific adenine glycosylase